MSLLHAQSGVGSGCDRDDGEGLLVMGCLFVISSQRYTAPGYRERVDSSRDMQHADLATPRTIGVHSSHSRAQKFGVVL